MEIKVRREPRTILIIITYFQNHAFVVNRNIILYKRLINKFECILNQNFVID